LETHSHGQEVIVFVAAWQSLMEREEGRD